MCAFRYLKNVLIPWVKEVIWLKLNKTLLIFDKSLTKVIFTLTKGFMNMSFLVVSCNFKQNQLVANSLPLIWLIITKFFIFGAIPGQKISLSQGTFTQNSIIQHPHLTFFDISQSAFTCSKLTIETLEQVVYFLPCSSVSNVNFEQVNANWDILSYLGRQVLKCYLTWCSYFEIFRKSLSSTRSY